MRSLTWERRGEAVVLLGLAVAFAALVQSRPLHGLPTWVWLASVYVVVGTAAWVAPRWVASFHGALVVGAVAALPAFAIRVDYLLGISDASRSLEEVLWTYPLVWEFHVLLPWAVGLAFALGVARTPRERALAVGVVLLPYVATATRAILGGHYLRPRFAAVYFAAQLLVGLVLGVPTFLVGSATGRD